MARRDFMMHKIQLLSNQVDLIVRSLSGCGYGRSRLYKCLFPHTGCNSWTSRSLSDSLYRRLDTGREHIDHTNLGCEMKSD